MRLRHLALGGVLGSVLLAACTSSPASVSTAAPPIKICGQTLYAGANGIPVYNFTRGTTYTIPNPFNKPGQTFVIRFAAGCGRGSVAGLSTDPGLKVDSVAVSGHNPSGPVSTIAIRYTRVGTAPVVLTVFRGLDAMTRIVLPLVDANGRPVVTGYKSTSIHGTSGPVYVTLTASQSQKVLSAFSKIDWNSSVSCHEYEPLFQISMRASVEPSSQLITATGSLCGGDVVSYPTQNPIYAKSGFDTGCALLKEVVSVLPPGTGDATRNALPLCLQLVKQS